MPCGQDEIRNQKGSPTDRFVENMHTQKLLELSLKRRHKRTEYLSHLKIEQF